MTEDELELYRKQELSIKKLPAEKRVKTFKYEWDIAKDQAFAISRLRKAEAYYKTLTYEECMNLTHN